MIPRKRLTKLHTTNVVAAAPPTPTLTPTPSPSPLRILVPSLHNLPHWRLRSTRPKPFCVWWDGCDRAWWAYIHGHWISASVPARRSASGKATDLSMEVSQFKLWIFQISQTLVGPRQIGFISTSEVRDSVINSNGSQSALNGLYLIRQIPYSELL